MSDLIAFHLSQAHFDQMLNPDHPIMQLIVLDTWLATVIGLAWPLKLNPTPPNPRTIVE